MSNDFDGEDAFREVLDRLIAAEGRIALANAAAQDARIEADGHRSTTDVYRKQNAELRKQNEMVSDLHDLLTRIKAWVEHERELPPEYHEEMLVRLSKAIADTDPIPF